MTHVIRSVHLNLEAVRIMELERFFRIAALELQIEFLEFVRTSSIDPALQIVVIKSLRQSDHRLAQCQRKSSQTPRMWVFTGCLFSGIFKELLVKYQGTVELRNLNRHVGYTDGAEASFLLRALCGSAANVARERTS